MHRCESALFLVWIENYCTTFSSSNGTCSLSNELFPESCFLIMSYLSSNLCFCTAKHQTCMTSIIKVITLKQTHSYDHERKKILYYQCQKRLQSSSTHRIEIPSINLFLTHIEGTGLLPYFSTTIADPATLNHICTATL